MFSGAQGHLRPGIASMKLFTQIVHVVHSKHSVSNSLLALQVGYFHGYIDGVDYVFVDHPSYHHLGENIYGGDRMSIAFRCALLCKAALEAVWHVPCGGVHYGDDNLVYIANDWHTALLPVYLQVRFFSSLSFNLQSWS